MATPFSAKNANVRYNTNTVIVAREWNVDMDADEIDTTNFEGGGFTDRITGNKDCTFTITAHFDSSTNPLDVVGFQPGDNITNVRLYLNSTTSPYWSFPSAKCLKVSLPMKAKDTEGAILTWTFKNKGTFTAPTGNF